jgi:hypothetical protein
MIIGVRIPFNNSIANAKPSAFNENETTGFVIQAIVTSMFWPALKRLNIYSVTPKEAKPKNKATFEANLSPANNVAKAPTKSIINKKEISIMRKLLNYK